MIEPQGDEWKELPKAQWYTLATSDHKSTLSDVIEQALEGMLLASDMDATTATERPSTPRPASILIRPRIHELSIMLWCDLNRPRWNYRVRFRNETRPYTTIEQLMPAVHLVHIQRYEMIVGSDPDYELRYALTQEGHTHPGKGGILGSALPRHPDLPKPHQIRQFLHYGMNRNRSVAIELIGTQEDRLLIDFNPTTTSNATVFMDYVPDCSNANPDHTMQKMEELFAALTGQRVPRGEWGMHLEDPREHFREHQTIPKRAFLDF